MPDVEPPEPSGFSDRDLPLDVVDREASAKPGRSWWRVLLVPIPLAFVGFGGVVGLYFQPPGVQFVMGKLGLVPGGGTTTPIAIPLDPPAPVGQDVAPPPSGSVAGLGKLIPRGDVISLASPFGAGDARIDRVLVKEGQRVEEGEILVVLDNESTLEEAVKAAEANLAVREASKRQSEHAIRASLRETRASVVRARAAAEEASAEYERGLGLFSSGAISASSLDQLKSLKVQADGEVGRLEAALSRFSGVPAEQVDVVVSQRNVEAAEVELRKAETELERAYIRAPLNATVLELKGRPGERPGPDGVLDVGDLAQMVAELEIYQSHIARVAEGQHVEMRADALDHPLYGVVRAIGMSVGLQALVGTDPAANTDARVIKVYVDLDEESTARAARFTNLQVVAHIDVDGAGE